MKVSIVTPVLNDRRVGRALESVFAQDIDSELEIIVIDGGSDYGTLDVIRRYIDRIDVLVSESDEGIYDGMNKGIERATGDVIGILNADDRYADAHVLSDVVRALEYRGVGICYGNIVYESAHGRRVRYWRSGPSGRLKWGLGWMPPHPGLFVRRQIYEQFGNFNTSIRIAADYELMLRLLYKHNLESVHLDRVLVRMELGGESNRSAANVLRAAFEVRRAWQINGLKGGELAALLKPLGKVDQYFRRPTPAANSADECRTLPGAPP